ncbi:hypothetical protein OAN307_c17310 [Octadecabacter antarcticus 307]|uniref:Uncharacterized protein n=1 Tax=Octadecabacter antarcticus 307 TaxID=391626 RepID=M9RAL9_9RHOB|nr:hypothetical protein [Octadecabacter antarcticus]AGI67396.1 hypothetical protein OAN307_c17310 [Octadecabacter antarcticus 307]
MYESNDDVDIADSRKKYVAIRVIIDKYFSVFEPDRIAEMTDRFMCTKEFGLYENWAYENQLMNLSKLRKQLQLASRYLREIHPAVLSEVSDNLTLLIEVLNGSEDRKKCADEVFDLAPTGEEVAVANKVFEGRLSFSENIDKAIKYTQDELPFGIPVRNRNVDALKVVEAAVELIRTYKCAINVPEKMNGYGPLRPLLIDLLEHYKINANVDAAFNSWVNNIDRKREFFELLPMD